MGMQRNNICTFLIFLLFLVLLIFLVHLSKLDGSTQLQLHKHWTFPRTLRKTCKFYQTWCKHSSSKHGECCEAIFFLVSFLNLPWCSSTTTWRIRESAFYCCLLCTSKSFPAAVRAFSTNFCSTTFAQRVFNNTHSEWTFASAYASLSPPASSSSPALVGLIFETEHKSSYCLKEPSLSLIRSGGVSALANSVDNRDQSERLLQTDSTARVEGHQHFSIWMTSAYECNMTHLRRNVELSQGHSGSAFPDG